MTDSAIVPTPAAVAPTRREIAAANASVQSAARWFWWITGLSLVNIVMNQTGSNTNFVIGLSLTFFADAMFASAKLIGFALDALILGFFFLMGLQASRGKLWAFYAGAAVYVVDALIYVMFNDWMSVGFHGLALFFIVRGAMSLRASFQEAGGR
jgi:hypothetical protein